MGPPEQKEKHAGEVIQIPALRGTAKSTVPQSNPDKEATRKRLEAFVHETRASETVAKAIAQVQQRQKEDSKPLYRQITETFEPTPESIWEEIDMLEGDPAHRGMAKCNARFKPFWLTAEASESAKSGAACRFKARLIVRGFEMDKGKDYDQKFSPTSGIAIDRIISHQ
jgi:hypothetical protein